MDIYRYMSFSELYNLVKHNKLKFSKLSLMDDKNEGLAAVLESVLPSEFGLNNGMTKEELVQSHKKIQDRNYISCWSEEKDSIAMWLLYSKNQDCIKVKTTYHKLEKVSNNFCKKNYWSEHLHSDEGTMQTSDSQVMISKVDYKNFSTLVEEVENFCKKINMKQNNFFKINIDNGIQKELVNKLFSKNREIEFSTMLDYFREEAQKIINNALFVKDYAYRYESEIRAIIRVNRRNEVTHKDIENADKESMPFIFGLMTYGDVPLNYFSSIIEIPVENNFVDEICFDPRMPTFQKKIYKEILGLDDSVFVETNIFGYLPEDLDLNIKYDYFV